MTTAVYYELSNMICCSLGPFEHSGTEQTHMYTSVYKFNDVAYIQIVCIFTTHRSSLCLMGPWNTIFSILNTKPKSENPTLRCPAGDAPRADLRPLLQHAGLLQHDDLQAHRLVRLAPRPCAFPRHDIAERRRWKDFTSQP